ncbi:hypothetical protein K6Y31_14070 [Motilimonas cestriensis]|uniref:EF-hand domain-containing protein n=1 Tax=Motilimonas cestriensis TaxID=2742685 RepID=A0ABS8WA80_9GAMM|nr:hypothetical protein [Motilimonas cestriensis]MCE2595936.1 hypothetical protein [Motilimonas cestriensis]
MKDVITMAGNFTSHSIWNVSEGETLIPILGYLDHEGKTPMKRLAMGSADAIAMGERSLSELSNEYKGATFIKDGYVTLDSGRTDSLIVDVKFTEDPKKSVQFLLPYRNANHELGFAIHRLKVSGLEGFAPEDVEWISTAFFAGLESHEQGGKIWAEQYEDQAGNGSGYEGEGSVTFSPEEFDRLKQAPFLIFFLVAAADGKVDKKEMKQFADVLTHPDFLANQTMNRIITNIMGELPEQLMKLLSQEFDFMEELAALKVIVEQNLSESQANEFKVALLMMGKLIAEASGGFFGFGSKISKQEKAALAAIAICLDIQL